MRNAHSILVCELGGQRALEGSNKIDHPEAVFGHVEWF
jgi:hypothetical protein